MNLNIIAIVVACVAAGGIYAATVQKGVEKERARVELKASQSNAKAQSARRAVAAAPASSLLEKYYRD